ncbi:MAG: hypothetical protein LJF06_10555 [Gemmatimonadetes bacterium]|nr:hypothetical protein [Gemmatimonadota bacterium]
MRSEHLSNLHVGWIIGGWLVAVAVTSGAYLALVGTGLFPEGPGAILGIAVAMAAGFYAGGLFVGNRWMDAPILHGVAMTLVSVVVLFVGTLTLPEGFGAWSGSAPTVLGLILLQLAASVAGGWTGRSTAMGSGKDDGARTVEAGGPEGPGTAGKQGGADAG